MFFVFAEIVPLVAKCIWKGKRTRVAKTILLRKDKVERMTLINAQAYYIAIIIETV